MLPTVIYPYLYYWIELSGDGVEEWEKEER
jgi:hypothetical protein